MESFHRALAMGAHGLEFDVRRTADGLLVVVHDPRIGRMSVSRETYAALRSSRRGAALPLLTEVLREFGGAAWLDIELKVEGIEEQVLDLTHQHCRPARFVITSFDRNVIARVKQLDGGVATGWLFDRAVKPHLWQDMAVDYLAPHHRVLRPALAEAARARDVALITWTVNSPIVLRRAIELGASIIITDHPDVMLSAHAP